jgi:hypothetical protein
MLQPQILQLLLSRGQAEEELAVVEFAADEFASLVGFHKL